MTSTGENREAEKRWWQYTCEGCGKVNDMREVYGRCPHPSREELHPVLWDDNRIESERRQRMGR